MEKKERNRERERWREGEMERGRERGSYTATLFAKGGWKALTSWGTLRERRKRWGSYVLRGEKRGVAMESGENGYSFLAGNEIDRRCRTSSQLPRCSDTILLSTPLFALTPSPRTTPSTISFSSFRVYATQFPSSFGYVSRAYNRYLTSFLIFIDHYWQYWKLFCKLGIIETQIL